MSVPALERVQEYFYVRKRNMGLTTYLTCFILKE